MENRHRCLAVHYDNRVRVLLWIGLLAALMVVGTAGTARASCSIKSFVVTTTTDTADNAVGDGICGDALGNCSLRAAIQEANYDGCSDVITFVILNSDPNCNAITSVCTITPTSTLPTISQPVTIDGYTQPGSRSNMLANGDDAILRIEISGASSPSGGGLTVSASNCTIRGLVINRFSGTNSDAIRLSGGSNTVSGNFLGTDPTGTAALANARGLTISSGGNFIGGPYLDMRNVISGNSSFGINIVGTSGTGNTVQNNIIGAQADGVTALGNTSIGVRLVSTAGTGNAILSNAIFSNGGLGIDLKSDGVSANDACDADSGPNLGQNFPALTSASSDGINTVISGTLNSAANGEFTIQFFDSPSCDASGYGQGQILIGSTNTFTNESCQATFTAMFVYALAPGRTVTATATDLNGNTSEFSQCLTAAALPTVTPTNTPTQPFIPTPPDTPTMTPTSTLPPATATPGCMTKTFVVASTADGHDVSVGDGLCVDAVGNCTLRAAIEEANADTCADVINFNIPSADSGCNATTHVCTITPQTWLQQATQPLTIDGYTQPGASPNSLASADNAVLLIEIDGTNVPGTNGIQLQTGNSSVRGLVVNRFLADVNGSNGCGIFVSSGLYNTIAGNFLGTDPTGTTSLANGRGLCVGSQNALIGGAGSVAARNVISGNGVGIGMGAGAGVASNTVENNFIGVQANGTGALGNAGNGIHLNGATTNVIGGTSVAARNIIAANNPNLQIDNNAAGNLIVGNYIGTDVSGTLALTPGHHGVVLNGAANNTIGGVSTGSGNLISGNGGIGVNIGGTSYGTIVQGNSIGLSSTGAALGNTRGITLGGASYNNTIGGTTPGAGNTIADNVNGVLAFNSAAGGNTILSNSIFGNTALGIDLGADGVTANDTCDPDTGPNGRQNFPVLLSASSDGYTTTITGTLNSTPVTGFTIQFFDNSSCDASGYGQGQTLIGSTMVVTDIDCGATFTVPFSYALPGGHVVTATATDFNGNTSEFSACSAFVPPTGSPTTTPTSTPTDTPTSMPTDTPTNKPTHSPTSTPTDTPTLAPTPTPTGSPTHTPTSTATVTPTDTATQTPTSTPICAGAPSGTACDDGLFCNGTDTCDGAGSCANHSGSPCNDNDACTADSCTEQDHCAHVVNVEGPCCDNCNDGYDNDGDGNIDAEDPDCSSLAEQQRFSIVSQSLKGPFSMGGSVEVNSAPGELSYSLLPYPKGKSKAGVCVRDAKITSGAKMGFLVITKTKRGVTFGQGNTGEHDISIRDDFSTDGAKLTLKTRPPFVGPGLCSNNMTTTCAESNSPCDDSSAEACCPVADATCDGRQRLDCTTNAYSDCLGGTLNFQKCANSLTSLDTEAQAVDAVPANVPGYTDCSVVVKTSSSTTTVDLPASGALGPGLQIICLDHVKIAVGGTLTIHGGASTFLYIRINKKMTFGGNSQVVLADGLKAENLLWYVKGDLTKPVDKGRGGSIVLKVGNKFQGTLLAPRSKVKIGGLVEIDGAVYASRVAINRSSKINHFPFLPLVDPAPCP